MIVLLFSLTLNGQDDKKTLKPINSNNIYQLDNHLSGLIKKNFSLPHIIIQVGHCEKGAINNPIYLIDGLHIIDSTCSRYILVLNLRSVDSIEIRLDTVINSNGKISGKGLVIMHTKDTAYLTLKLINKLTHGWSFRYPLTRYFIEEEELLDSNKIKVLSNLKPNVISRIDTIINKDFPDGLIKIELKKSAANTAYKP